MSFVGFNSIIYSIEDSSEGVKVVDLNNIWEYMQREDIPLSSFKGEDKKDGEEYPYQYYKYLYGFTTYDDIEFYLIERLGYEYSKEDFLDFWKNISKCCEPFYFYHLPDDTCRPMNVFDVAESKDSYFYKVVCVNGKVEVHKLEAIIKHASGNKT